VARLDGPSTGGTTHAPQVRAESGATPVTLLAGTFDEVVRLVQALVWPFAALLILLALRPYLPEIVKGLARRVTRVSWASVSMEFAVASEVRPEIWGALQSLRDPASQGLVAADSGGALFMLIREGERSDSATFDLGTGDRWLTSRLFIFAVILSELLGVRCMVFIETRDGVPRRFVGLAAPRDVRAALQRRWDWHERALMSAQLNFSVSTPEAATKIDQLRTYLGDPATNVQAPSLWNLEPMLRPLFAEAVQVGLGNAQAAEAAANAYLRSPLIAREVDEPFPQEERWVRLGAGAPGKVREEHAQWIKNADHLSRILRDVLKTPSLVEGPGVSLKDLEQHAVLIGEGEFVAILDPEQRFKRLLNRRAVVERVGRQIAESGADA
jgi:hypothetical protein